MVDMTSLMEPYMKVNSINKDNFKVMVYYIILVVKYSIQETGKKICFMVLVCSIMYRQHNNKTNIKKSS